MPPNVLLVVMDAVRARNTSLHGYECETTPFLETFAEGATTYTQARSPGIWSLPSHASIFTGLHVVEHGITEVSDRLSSGHSVWEALADEEGYATGVFSENEFLTGGLGVGLRDTFQTVVGSQNAPYPEAGDPNQPYHKFVSRSTTEQVRNLIRESLEAEESSRTFVNGLTTKLQWDHPGLLPEGWTAADTPAEVFTDRFLSWNTEQDGPWAACINYLDAHAPHHPPEEFDHWGGPVLRSLQAEMDDVVWEFNGGNRPWWQRKALESLYDGGIRYMDAEIERLLSTLDERGELEDTLVVVTADHGEGFGEPSRIRPDTRVPSHKSGIHEVLLHVPLIVKYPGQTDSRVVEEAASLTEFPVAVRAAIEGERDDEAFVPEGLVYASSHGLEKPMEERALRHVDDVWRFNGDALAIFETMETGVRKYASWRDTYGLDVTALNARESYVSGEGGHERANEAFADLTDSGVKERTDGDIDTPARNRLEDLGYI